MPIEGPQRLQHTQAGQAGASRKDILTPEYQSLMREEEELLEQIRVTSGSHEAQFTSFDSVDQQPVRFNMALAAVFQGPFQAVVLG